MASFMHTGAAGFNHRPSPHSAPFWDMNAIPRSTTTKEETEVLDEWRLQWGPLGPTSEWLELHSTIGMASSRLAKRQFKFLEEQSRKPGVMGRLQPRLQKNKVSVLATNPQLAAKYYPYHFTQFTKNVKPALHPLSPAEAKEKNMYYPNQPGVIMIVSIYGPFTSWPYLSNALY